MERERENANGLCVLPHQMQSNRWNAFFIRDYGWSLFTHRLGGIVMCALGLVCACGFVASIRFVAFSMDAQHFTILFWLSCYRRAGHFQDTFQYHHFNQYDMINVINESEMNGAFCLSHSSRLLHVQCTHTNHTYTCTMHKYTHSRIRAHLVRQICVNNLENRSLDVVASKCKIQVCANLLFSLESSTLGDNDHSSKRSSY